MSFYTVEKLPRADKPHLFAFAVVSPLNEIEVAYASKRDAERGAMGATNFMVGDAEEYNRRFTAARAYLATRAARALRPRPQLELF